MKVQKNDGSFQEFDRTKIVGGVVKSGGTAEQAESIASQIEAWAPSVTVGGVIKSADIKVKLLELLGAVNPAAKASFEGFVKPNP
jgi:hypothetical protein